MRVGGQGPQTVELVVSPDGDALGPIGDKAAIAWRRKQQTPMRGAERERGIDDNNRVWDEMMRIAS